MTASELIARAAEIRSRLRRPPNAVPDREIDLGLASRAAEAALAEIILSEYTPAVPPPPPPPISEKKKKPQTLDAPIVLRIQRAVARFYGISRDDLIGPCRRTKYALPRQIAIYIVKELTGKSFPGICRWFGRDHTTVLYSCRKIARLRDVNPQLDAKIRFIIDSLDVEYNG